jgi:ribosomal protein L3 glutamine methyltransferase
LIVELALERLPDDAHDGAGAARMLDMGTGSGAIAVACAHTRPDARVTALDVSDAALAVARANAAANGVRVRFLRSSWFDGLDRGERFELIVSNPPYVDAEDFADMPAEYQHEPALGLACGSDGLNLVRRMLAEAADHLTEKGLLIVEVGNSQVHVQALYPEVDFHWLDFERGGHGVFMLGAAQCREHQALFASKV